MTTEMSEDIVCAVCNAESTQTILMSTNTMEPPDLDLRPGEMYRSTMHLWVQRCPRCGYCAPSIDEGLQGASGVIRSREYREQLCDPDLPELANSFLCASMIQEQGGDYASAGLSSMYAAWACDDRGAPEQARSCRLKAYYLFVKARSCGQEFARDPGSEDCLLVDILRRSGEYERALSTCEEALDGQPDPDIVDILNFQKELISRGDSARHSIGEVRRRPSGDTLPQHEPPSDALMSEHINHMDKAIELHKGGLLEEAVNEYLAAIRLYPDNYVAHEGLALCYLQLEMFDEAEREYREALRLDPEDQEVLLSLANLLNLKGSYSESIDIFEELLYTMPDNPDVHRGLATALFELGQIGEAQEELEEVLRLDPSDCETHSNLGLVLGLQGFVDEAFAEFQTALELMPDYTDAHYNLGMVYELNDMQEEAKKKYEEALETDPDHVKSLCALAGVYKREGRFQEAISLFKRTLELAPDLDVAWFNLAGAYYDCGESDKSLDAYQRFLQYVTEEHLDHVEPAKERIRELGGE